MMMLHWRWRLGVNAAAGLGRGAAILLVCLATAAAGAPAAGIDVRRWLPEETRAVLEIDPAAATRQPLARDALSLDALLERLPHQRPEGVVARHLTVAYIVAGGTTAPVVFSSFDGDLGRRFGRLHGAQLENVGGHPLYRAAGEGKSAIALLSTSCVVEGAPQAVRTVMVQQGAARGRLADLPPDSSTRRLFEDATTAPITLVYLAPAGGSDLATALRDLDRLLDAGIAAGLEPYESALRMLGSTSGLRVDLHQERNELGTSLRIAMPNAVAAQMASVSLLAGRGMARVASDAAVRAGTLRPADAKVVDAMLGTLQARADGDFLRVQLRVSESASQMGSR